MTSLRTWTVMAMGGMVWTNRHRQQVANSALPSVQPLRRRARVGVVLVQQASRRPGLWCRLFLPVHTAPDQFMLLVLTVPHVRRQYLQRVLMDGTMTRTMMRGKAWMCLYRSLLHDHRYVRCRGSPARPMLAFAREYSSVWA